MFDRIDMRQRYDDLPSRFIRPIHPKTSIAPDAIGRVVAAGWWGQPKIHGHRAQIHLPAEADQRPLVYNREGRLHKEPFPDYAAAELRRLFPERTDWIVLDSEWRKTEGKITFLTFLKQEGKTLERATYSDRYELLPQLIFRPASRPFPSLSLRLVV